MAATTAGFENESIGFENTRLDPLSHTGHATNFGDAPSGRFTSKRPWS
jgi:hypothetical protein